MYKSKIRNLEVIVEGQTRQIDKMIADPNRNQQEFMALNQQRSMNLRELSRLRKLQFEEDHERVGFDDDR